MKFSTFGIRPHLSFVTSALLLAALVFTVFALAPAGAAQAQQDATDYDADDDGLIEVSNLAQLNAIRWDLDGNGTASTGNESNYAAAFPSAAAGMGCPNGDHDNDANTPDQPVCTGYELTVNLDFDTDGDGDVDSSDDYWNGGSGWLPFGDNSGYKYNDGKWGWDSETRFTSTFVGNGHTIANLFVSRGSTNYVGLFGSAGPSAAIRNLGLTNVDVTGNYAAGGLAGENTGSVGAAYATGSVNGNDTVGGLVGSNYGNVSTSYATAGVTGYLVSSRPGYVSANGVGGLVGRNRTQGSITASYATGSVTGNTPSRHRGGRTGGLVGENDGSVGASYATGSVTGIIAAGGLVGYMYSNSSVTVSYWNTETSGQATSAGGTGETSAELRAPTGATGIYANWDANVWDFGADYNYPVLKADFNGDGTATWQEFGLQRDPGPVDSLSAALDSSNNIEITWTAPTDAGSGTLSDYQYRVSADGGATWSPDWTDTSSLSHTITPAEGESYTFEVRATSDAAHSPGAASRIGPLTITDYDADDDGLIEVSNLAQLNAIRWDLDGDGTASTGNESNYAVAFPNPAAGMGCPNGDHDNDANTPDEPVCAGYELTADLDFDTDGDGDVDSSDAYWNGGSGWVPIGDVSSDNVIDNAADNPFLATFDGNGHTVSNLYINRGSTDYIGLFGYAGSAAAIHNLGLTNVNVTGNNDVGGLAGHNRGSISGSYVTGSVTGHASEVGGMVGDIHGSISDSYATVSVSSSGSYVGGLIGGSTGSSITDSYATGSVSGNIAGGLAGNNTGTVTNSYWNTETSGRGNSDVGTGKTTTELRAPTRATGIYANWDANVWDFGADYNYPVLKADRNGDGTATWQEFGQQREPGPVQNLAAALDSSNNIEVTWAAPTDTGSGTLGDYQYRVSVDGGVNWSPDWTDTSSLSHTITPAVGASYTFEVRATSNAVHSPGAASRIGPLTITDYDADDDGLIEVDNLLKLNAVRWDPDGDGSAANAGYAAAFPLPETNLGCPASSCTGYELTAALDFDTGTAGDRSDDAYYNAGAGWEPILDFDATFDGNGHAIANLFIDREDDYMAGLFGFAGPGAVIRNLTLTNVSVTGDESVAGLAGENEGSISGVSVSGSVSGEIAVGGLAGYNAGSIVSGAAGGTVTGYTGEAGGLVGYNDGTIRSSSATAAVSAPAGGVGREMGGLAGHNAGTITASHATGSVSGFSETGGLVGGNGSSGAITASYATGDVTGNASAGGLVGGNSGLVSASYATGVVSGAANAGGLVGLGTRGTVTGSYYDQETSGRAFGIGSDDLDNDNTVDEEAATPSGEQVREETNTLPGSATAELQTPTGYTGIYETWDDHDIDGDGSADAPWNFGTDQDYPVLE